jgi:hypothetical protein
MSDSRRRRYVFETAGLLLGLVTGFVSYALRQDLQLSLMLGFVVTVGLLVVEVTAEIGQIQSASTHSKALLETMHRSLVARDQYLATLDHLQRNPSGTLADSLARLHTALAEVPPALFIVAADMLAEPIQWLEHRHIVVPGDSSSLGSHLVRTFQSDVFTTSFHPLGFWKTPYGRNYNQAICDRLRSLTARGVNVRFRRVYIVRDALSHELREGFYQVLIRSQLDAGVEVRVVEESRLPADLLVDFGVWDSQLEVELECDDQRRIIRRHYRYSAEAIIAAHRRAGRVWDGSIDFDEWLREEPRT